METSDKSLKCVIKKAVLMRVGCPSVDFKSGCSIIDVTFPSLGPVEIGSIHFQNSCTASLSLKFKTSGDAWKICLKKFELMASAHCENGSQDKFIIKSDQMLQPIKDAVLLRIILRQPSPHWVHFSIEDLCFFPPTQTILLINREGCGGEWVKLYSQLQTKLNRISSPLSEILSPSMEGELSTKLEEDVRAVDVAGKLQQLWALTETVGDDQVPVVDEAPHFDIDGCYDLNLLSYT